MWYVYVSRIPENCSASDVFQVEVFTPLKDKDAESRENTAMIYPPILRNENTGFSQQNETNRLIDGFQQCVFLVYI